VPPARVIVVGLGPGGPELVTAGTLAAVARVATRFLRTTRHPAAGVVGDATSFDHLYERAERIGDVYPAIVEALVEAAGRHGEVLYAVPGSPRVAERSVELLVADPRVAVDVLPALSFLDLAWVRLGVDPVETGVRLVDGHDFAVGAAGERGPLLVAQCDSRAVLSAIKLSVPDPAPDRVVVLQRLGLPDERVVELPWVELDREVEPDHLTSLYVPVLASPVGAELVRMAELGRTLRERCDWDREQTHESLRRYLLDEAYEVLEAIDHLDPDDPESDAHLEEELGDVLYQVVFHAAIAAEEGRFDLADVARGIHDKLVRRHPHVFGDVVLSDPDELDANWERIKKAEKGRTSELDGLTLTLPSLMLASEVLKRAARVGLAREHAPAATAPTPAPPTATGEDALGEALLALVADARAAGVDAEQALRRAALRVADEARAVEAGSPGRAPASGVAPS
jgi:tetrapyrrole methylase family protein/MazG family protein